MNDIRQTGQDTRTRLIEAALQLFEKQGYKGTPTRLIAEVAGVNEVTLFRHFGNKKALLIACMEYFNAAGFSGTFEGVITGDYAADILSMAQHQVESTIAGYSTVHMLMCERSRIPELQSVLMQGASDNVAVIESYFQRQINAGVIRAGLSAQVLAIAFDNMFSSALIMQTMFSGKENPAPPSEDLLQLLVDVFVRGTSV